MTSPNPARDEAEQTPLDIAMDALFDVRRAIFNADPKVLTDTLWMPADTYKGGTVVDFIENEMERVRTLRFAAKPPASGVDAVARLAYGYELMHTALCHIAGTSGADRHWYVHKAQEITERITRVGEVTADSNPGKPGDCLRGYRQFVASLSPAATSGSEDGDAGAPTAFPDPIWGQQYVNRVLAKPASSPAGGDVREALKIAERRFLDIAQGLALNVTACAEAGAEEIRAALSPSTSAAEPVCPVPPHHSDRCSCSEHATPPAPAAVDGQRVKALVWNEYETEGEVDRWDAETALGTFYEISTQFDGYHVAHDCTHLAARFDTLDDAKAAAQADYEARIRACLASDKEGE
jgi:hypothetical protein